MLVIMCFLSFISLPNRLNVLCAFNFQCYRQVTHQINLELICSLFESGGTEINIQVTVLLSTSRFLVYLTDTFARVKNLIPPICQPMLCPTSWLTVDNFSVNISPSCYPYNVTTCISVVLAGCQWCIRKLKEMDILFLHYIYQPENTKIHYQSQTFLI